MTADSFQAGVPLPFRLWPQNANTDMLNRRTLLTKAGATVAAGLQICSGSATGSGSRTEKIRIGQIGTGHAHATKLSVYRSSADYEVVGIVEPDAVRRKKAESQEAFRDVPFLTEEQLLNAPGLQAVLVETDVRDLLATAERCLRSGKHVHVDKPAGESLSELRRVLNAAEERRLLVQMGYMYRYNPGVRLLHEFLANGWLGEIFEVHAVMSKVIDPSSRQQLFQYPGGVMFELGCHLIDLVVAILGKPGRVTAFPRHSAAEADPLLDNMLAVLEYPQATASVRSSGLEVEGFSRRHLVVCGTKGTFQVQPLDNPTVRISLDEPHAQWKKGTQEIALPGYVRYVDDAADMARILRGEKKSDFSAKHDLDVQETVLLASALKAE